MRHENKLWSFLFFAMTAFSVGIFVMAGTRWWFTEDVSTYGRDIDHLFNVILAITGIIFVITELVLCWAVLRYGRKDDPRPALFMHGNHQLEMIWTLIPAGILLFIALYQMGTWKLVKFSKDFPKAPLHAEVVAGQFEWRIAYPGKDGKLGTRDDVHGVNHLHAYKGGPILIHLKSRDVLHSFFLPNFRLKQDAVPGMTIPMWFEFDKAKQPDPAGYELMCAELCGWGHYKMKGWLTVHPSKADFDKWLEQAKSAEEADNDREVAQGPGEKKDDKPK